MRKGVKHGCVGPKIIKDRCVTFGCKKPVYALWLCRSCYEQARRLNSVTPKVEIRCFVKDCTNTYTFQNGKNEEVTEDTYKYCAKHRVKAWRLRQLGRPLNDENMRTHKAGEQFLGAKNHNWNGGCFPYLHFRAYMKKRKEILKKHKNKCQNCGGHAVTVRHVNNDPTDHRDSNLRLLCHSCLSKTCKRRDEKYMTKYRQMFGKTLAEIAREANVTSATAYGWIRMGWKPGTSNPFLKRRQNADVIFQASKRYGVSPMTVRLWIKKGLWKPGQEKRPVRRRVLSLV